jgi:iron complex transport system substrate-binding protein
LLKFVSIDIFTISKKKENDRLNVENKTPKKMAKVTRLKVILTIVIILSGTLITFAVNGLGSDAYQSQTEGVVIDFGDYETVWTDADYNEVSSALGLLEYACEHNNYTYTFDDNGFLIEVNGVLNTDTTTWGLWYVVKGSINLTEANNYSINASNYTGIVWAYCIDGDEPAIIVDASGTNIYGYSQSNRIVSLSPVATEILGSLNAIDAVVGTDSYSDYPSSVITGKANGSIAVVGTYTSPSYESIMNTTPDMVICDGSQYNQIQMLSTIRTSSINAILLYDGESIETILNNIFIVGIAIGYNIRAQVVLTDLDYAVDEIESALESGGYSDISTMISLSSDPSPYVAGNYTYADNILINICGLNIFHSMNGWIHINSEYISQYNPSVIIIYSTEYSATQSDYDLMLSNLSAEWKSTDAYKSGNIYLFADELGEMAQRAGPRFAQLMELTARILHPNAFGDGIIVPKYLGNNYEDYLTITKDLGFDS